MSTIEKVSANKSHGGTQWVYKHQSQATGTGMTFSVFVPPQPGGTKLPVVCICRPDLHPCQRHRKSEFRKACAELG